MHIIADRCKVQQSASTLVGLLQNSEHAYIVNIVVVESAEFVSINGRASNAKTMSCNAAQLEAMKGAELQIFAHYIFPKLHLRRIALKRSLTL